MPRPGPRPRTKVGVGSGQKADSPRGTPKSRSKETGEPPAGRRRKLRAPPGVKLEGTAKELWDEYIEPCWWILQCDALLAAIFVYTYAEYMQTPDKMGIYKIQELRKMMNELSLTTSEQIRIGAAKPMVDDGKTKLKGGKAPRKPPDAGEETASDTSNGEASSFFNT